jgi:hypothetical protein
MRRTIKICLIFSIILLLNPLIFAFNYDHLDSQKYLDEHNYLKGGWIEERDNVKILHISGSHYEMGYQYGYLLKNELNENIRAVLEFSAKKGFTLDWLVNKWLIREQYTHENYVNELLGIAEGAGISYEKIIATHMAFETCGIMQCFGIAAWNNSTSDGSLLHAKSFDRQSVIIDPISGKNMYENQVLVIRKPSGGYASITPTLVGRINGGGGFNEKGIAYSIMLSWSIDQSFFGPNFIISGQQILDYSSSIDETLGFILDNGTLGWNYIISDSNIPIAYIVESSGNKSYVGKWDDPTESIRPFWRIDHLVRRTNFFINPDLAIDQRKHYNIAGIIGFFDLLKYDLFSILNINPEDIPLQPFFPIWRDYKVMSNELEKLHGVLNLTNMLSVIRDVYSGRSDILLHIMRLAASGHGFQEACNQWVCYPDKGDILVSFADGENYAQFNEIHYFNFYDLLNATPP